jgi:uncharacterized membrane protein
MEHRFDQIAQAVALTMEGAAVLLIGWGALRAFARVMRLSKAELENAQVPERGRSVFIELARYVLLGLEFTLAADVVRTAIAPSWTDIGKLASIAAIRTFLNYFLERDVERARTVGTPLPAARSGV